MDDETKKVIEGKYLSLCSPEMAYESESAIRSGKP
jgi:hypothetical protein